MSVSCCISLYVSIFIFFKVRGNGDNDIMYTYYQYCLTSIVRSTVLGRVFKILIILMSNLSLKYPPN